jgi:hypothetical protein
LFEKGDDGTLSLLESDFVNQWTQEADLYLNKGKSIPGFLSAVSLGLWSMSTTSI